MSGEQQIDYEALAQDARRGVVRTVLARIAKSGLPGEHHFYIAFYTQAPGVIISKRIREKYPEEMTIVLQHRFWDLAVQDDRFEVKLTFDAIPERLVVPFNAVKVFFDPSVPYGLQFDEPGLEAGSAFKSSGDSDDYPEQGSNRDEMEDASPRSSRAHGKAAMEKSDRKPAMPRKPKPVKAVEPGHDDVTPRVAEPVSKAPPPLRQKPVLAPVPTGEAVKSPADPTPGNDMAKVVQLDKFRKK